LNPLAVFITRTKLEAMRLDPTVLERLASRLIERLRTVASRLRLDRPFSAREHRLLAADLRLPNQEYLARWFAPSVLTQLARVEFEARRLRDPVVANTVRLVLSDLLRSVSLQDPGDLRIRRRKDAKDNYPAIPRFAELLERRVRAIASARRVLGNIRGVQEVARADVRVALGPQLKHLRAQDMFDAVITSPPYATALPYIDTQRLSLAFLGLASEAELRSLERALIGNREIGKRERDHDVQLIGSDGGILPTRVLRLCRRALRLLQKGPDGFRRQNTPALLFRYFKDMALAFANIRPLVKPGGRLAFVVGPNRTTLGGRPLTIDTPRLLLEVAEHVGWRRVELVSLDAYQRYDVHQRNSIRAETLVILCRPT
ncbi:MAG: hypothetical protein ACREA0_19525, partial [bacterium]